MNSKATSAGADAEQTRTNKGNDEDNHQTRTIESPPPARGVRRSACRMASRRRNELTIAYNVNLPSWDPTVGPSAVNPTIQGIYQSVFDQYIVQKPDL